MLIISCSILFVLFLTSPAFRTQPSRLISKKSLSGWLFFDGIEGRCSKCLLEDVDTLKKERDFKVGCVSKDTADEIPLCPLEAPDGAGSPGSSDQAGGHAGTIAKLTNGLLAKETKAFDDPDLDKSAIRHIEYSRIEYQVYMEMWCIRRLSQMTTNTRRGSRRDSDPIAVALAAHPLSHFALGKDPWAPRFHGVCKLPGVINGKVDESARPRLYIVQENMLADFRKPCQLDLKLGFNTVEPLDKSQVTKEPTAKGWEIKKVIKHMTHTVADVVSPSASTGARLAGYKVFSPFRNVFEKMASKWADPLTPLKSVFDKFFDESGRVADIESFEQFRDRLLAMSAWWADVGQDRLRSVALSALFAYECEPKIAGKIKLSDLSIEGELPAMDSAKSGGKADPYIDVQTFPRYMTFPNVDFGNSTSTFEITSTEANHDLTTRAYRYFVPHQGDNNRSNNPFVTSTLYGTLLPDWPGLQFDLLHAPALREITFDMWDEDPGAHDYIGRFILSLDTISEGANRLCLPIQACEQCAKQGAEPTLCFSYEHESIDVRPAAPARLKLIDYAHFYLSSTVTSEWDRDGVHEGLLSAIRELDRKTVSASGVSREGGDRWKCPDNTAGHHTLELALDTCKRYGIERHKKWVTWRPTSAGLGECRVCDSLMPRDGRKLMPGAPYQIFQL